MSPNDVRLEGLTPEQKRQVIYKAEADELLLSVLGYEREGDTTKANVQLALWNSKKAAIRAAHPDV